MKRIITILLILITIIVLTGCSRFVVGYKVGKFMGDAAMAGMNLYIDIKEKEKQAEHDNFETELDELHISPTYEKSYDLYGRLVSHMKNHTDCDMDLKKLYYCLLLGKWGDWGEPYLVYHRFYYDYYNKYYKDRLSFGNMSVNFDKEKTYNWYLTPYYDYLIVGLKDTFNNRKIDCFKITFMSDYIIVHNLEDDQIYNFERDWTWDPCLKNNSKYAYEQITRLIDENYFENKYDDFDIFTFEIKSCYSDASYIEVTFSWKNKNGESVQKIYHIWNYNGIDYVEEVDNNVFSDYTSIWLEELNQMIGEYISNKYSKE